MKRDDDFNEFDFEDDEVYEKPLKKRIFEEDEEEISFMDEVDESKHIKPAATRKPESYSDPDREYIREKKSPEQKSQYRVFLLLTVCIGFVVFILTLMMIFRVFSKNPVENGNPDSSSTIETAATTVPSTTETNTEGQLIDGAMITEIISASKIKLYQLSTSKLFELNFTPKSEIKNKFSYSLGIGEISQGDVVNVRYDEKTGDIFTMVLNSDTWDQKQVTGITVTPGKNTIKAENKVYHYDSQLICVYKGQPYDVASITPSDTVSMKGYQGNVLFIELFQGHGSITIINKDKIVNGVLEIDKDIFVNLNEAKDSYNVSEGSHKIKVTGDNIEDYIETITITEGDNKYIDLSKTSSKNAQLLVKANVDAKLTIDSKEYPLNSPIDLPLGIYHLKLEKSGYKTEERTIEIKSLQQTETFELVETVQVATLSVKTEPEGADIFIDNVYIGISPLKTSVTYGYHTITIKKPGYTSIDSPITVDKQDFPLELKLQIDYSIVTPVPSPSDDVINYTDIPVETDEPAE